MGKILGYPCYKNFENFDKYSNLFALEIIVSYNNNNIEIPLFANVCENKQNLIAQKAFDIFTSGKYKNILKGIYKC